MEVFHQNVKVELSIGDKTFDILKINYLVTKKLDILHSSICYNNKLTKKTI